MKIITDRYQLSNCLQKVQTILEKSSSLNNSENILIKAVNNQLQIIAFDNNCSAQGTVFSEIAREGTISLNGKRLYDIVRSLNDEKISIFQDENTSLITINDSKSSFNILSADIDEFPEINFSLPKQSLKIESDLLIQLIDLTIFSIAKISDPRYNLQGVFLEIEAVNGLVEDDSSQPEKDISLGSHLFSLIATNGHRVSVARTDQISGSISVGAKKIFSRKSLLEIKSVFSIKETLNLGFEKSEVVIWGSGFILSLRMLQGDFPDYRKMIPDSFIHHLELDKEPLLNTLKQMNLLAEDNYKGVFLNFSENGLEVSFDNPERGHGNTGLHVDYQGEPFQIIFNIKYLLDFLQAVPDTKIVLDINNKNQPCIIKGQENEHYMCGIMPIS
ncbi:DNA polymerase III subunit beta [bacterium]|nr:DNA polymerase III subunit beta [bacterium]